MANDRSAGQPGLRPAAHRPGGPGRGQPVRLKALAKRPAALPGPAVDEAGLYAANLDTMRSTRALLLRVLDVLR